ncbi:1,4-dihydroxy-2-naphthoate polyprenyltransferase [Dyadobacter sediminis]|uniref:1,4-dihydroxy-2-naphthoate octaprenyltransferase n=1 Tax=Dyadobacter sediminis TaxID=1493691 RepID=A0A5R9KEN2_9BACT|nr:1,4-dihydroxy-2-naphthoate polyprenyltransferase [Dyadobacter sediminis]TLU94569.1 1,4-dihydroxy-2-naphthoate polyprenyltransferase [Dyadobacter sediminis]GGB90113.1 1,4-dihydroxy-2-naphthoate octaprenyltransferase [Dyadobacter sediminis]
MNPWIEAARPRTLPLALSCILMGCFLAASKGNFSWSVAALSILTTILLQVLSNFANDYGDAVNGKDTDLREGPRRAVHSGHIPASAMLKAIILFSVLALVSGISLLTIALRNASANVFWVFLGIGIACIIAAITYTAGKRPYGYVGLGDLSVLIFFGWVGVLGSSYLHTHVWDWSLLLPATSCGLFAVGVLNINNIRDIESDRATGKNSIPVRLGREKAIRYHWCILLIGMLCVLIYTIQNFSGYTSLFFLLSFPLFIKNGLAVSRLQKASELDPYLKQMALSTLLFVILFGLGIIL